MKGRPTEVRAPDVLVVGVSRSGTTWSGLLIAHSLGMVCLGEVSLVLNDVDRGGHCACGEAIVECPVWQPALERAGVRDQSAARDLQRWLSAASMKTAIWNRPEHPLEVARAKKFDELLNGAVAASDTDGFVDTSKGLRMWRFYASRGDKKVRVLHVVRNPLHVAASNKSSLHRDADLFTPPGATPARAAFNWLTRNTVIFLLARLSGAQSAIVFYERLLESPRSETARILEHLELGARPQVEADTNHVAVGNPSRRFGIMAVSSGPTSSLTTLEKVQVDLITFPLRWYLRRLQLADYRSGARRV